MERYLVACDQGTTSSRAVLFSETGQIVKVGSAPLPVRFPNDGWVEQDPQLIWSTQEQALREALTGISPKQLIAIGITNQRETVLGWDRRSGKPLTPAIVWQCRRSSEICDKLRAEKFEETLRRETGLVCDPYFSGTKILWLLENIPGLREATKKRDAVFGTVDSWIVYQLTGGNGNARFVTEPTNASRTMCFSLNEWGWREELLRRFGIERENLAEVLPSKGTFGTARIEGVDVPISAVLGDQQASLLGHGAVAKGGTKCTFGTGAFMLLHCGNARPADTAGLIETALWEKKTFALEGSVFVAGAAVQWLRDQLGFFSSSAETEQLVASVKDSGGVICLPTFVGLGAPHWNQSARGALLGVTRDTSPAHIVRATFEGIANQIADIVETKGFSATQELRIDGGMSVNAQFGQILADYVGIPVQTAGHAEATALGVARLAAVEHGLFETVQDASVTFGVHEQKNGRRFAPALDRRTRENRRNAWREAVHALVTFHTSRLLRPAE